MLQYPAPVDLCFCTYILNFFQLKGDEGFSKAKMNSIPFVRLRVYFCDFVVRKFFLILEQPLVIRF